MIICRYVMFVITDGLYVISVVDEHLTVCPTEDVFIQLLHLHIEQRDFPERRPHTVQQTVELAWTEVTVGEVESLQLPGQQEEDTAVRGEAGQRDPGQGEAPQPAGARRDPGEQRGDRGLAQSGLGHLQAVQSEGQRGQTVPTDGGQIISVEIYFLQFCVS